MYVGTKVIGFATATEFLSLGATVLIVERITNIIAFLAIDISTYITDQNIVVFGGITEQEF